MNNKVQEIGLLEREVLPPLFSPLHHGGLGLPSRHTTLGVVVAS